VVLKTYRRRGRRYSVSAAEGVLVDVLAARPVVVPVSVATLVPVLLPVLVLIVVVVVVVDVLVVVLSRGRRDGRLFVLVVVSGSLLFC